MIDPEEPLFRKDTKVEREVKAPKFKADFASTAKPRSEFGGVVIFVASFLLLFLLIELSGYISERLSQPSRVDDTSKIFEETREEIPFIHRWHDTAPLMSRDGHADRPRAVDPGVMPMVVKSVIKRARLIHMVESFGMPESWEQRGKWRNLNDFPARCRKRGVNVRYRGEELLRGPSYDWIIKESRPDVRECAVQLQEIAKIGENLDQRELFRVVASFVQSMDYQIPALYRTLPSGERINTMGIALPIEILYHKWGDCDSKSLLFASLISHFAGESVVFLLGQDHLFVGVRAPPRNGDHYVELQGVPYVLIELTTPWRVGRIAPDTWRGVELWEFRVIKVL